MFERITPKPVLKGKAAEMGPLEESGERTGRPKVKLLLEIRRYHLA
ncbi:hypothetical protein [Thermococcus sp.]|nr:hypothetical protein [Thermococcus sp.]